MESNEVPKRSAWITEQWVPRTCSWSPPAQRGASAVCSFRKFLVQGTGARRHPPWPTSVQARPTGELCRALADGKAFHYRLIFLDLRGEEERAVVESAFRNRVFPPKTSSRSPPKVSLPGGKAKNSPRHSQSSPLGACRARKADCADITWAILTEY